MLVKAGVLLSDTHPWIQYAAAVVDWLHRAHGYGRATITGGQEGADHAGPGRVLRTQHPGGTALDFRTWALQRPNDFVAMLRQALGPAFDVVLEPDHLHVELSDLALDFLGLHKGIWT